MLVLSRKRGQQVMIGEDIVVRVMDIRGDNVRLGFEAPPALPVHREEVYSAIKTQRAEGGSRVQRAS